MLDINDHSFFENADKQFESFTGKPFNELSVYENSSKHEKINIILAICGIVLFFFSIGFLINPNFDICSVRFHSHIPGLVVLLISVTLCYLGFSGYVGSKKEKSAVEDSTLFDNFVKEKTEKYFLEYLNNTDNKYGKLTKSFKLAGIMCNSLDLSFIGLDFYNLFKKNKKIDDIKFGELIRKRVFLYNIFLYADTETFIVYENAYKFSDIISFEVFNNSTQIFSGQSTTDTGSLIGRAVIGGALLGGAGAVLGGASASRSINGSMDTTNDYNVRITINSFISPKIDIKFYDQQDILNEFISLIEIILHNRNK